MITGSSQGIGKSLAIGFAKLGANIIITGRNQENMETTLQQVEEQGARGIIVPGNVQNLFQKKGIENGRNKSSIMTQHTDITNQLTRPASTRVFSM